MAAERRRDELLEQLRPNLLIGHTDPIATRVQRKKNRKVPAESFHIRRLGRGGLQGFARRAQSLFPGAAVAVDVLPRSFHSLLIVSHQMQFMIGVGVVLRLEQLGTALAHLPH